MALGGCTAILITACIFEYGARGLNPPVDSDWVMHPTWWQSDLLADWGMYVRVLTVVSFGRVVDTMISGGIEKTLPFLFWSQLIFAVIGYGFMFYAAKGFACVASLGRSKPNKTTTANDLHAG